MERMKDLPPNTRLLTEGERVSILDDLIKNRKELNNIYETMPIGFRSNAMEMKREEIEKKLEELDKNISTFRKKDVYVIIQ